ncbi:MAG: hypothetical protein Q9168_004182 [Polycauliona sp. 1 TL-2023]
MFTFRYLAILFYLGAIRNSLAQKDQPSNSPEDRAKRDRVVQPGETQKALEGTYEFQYPINGTGDYFNVGPQDRINVWFTLNGTADETSLEIKCWARSEPHPPQSQAVFDERIALIEPTDFFWANLNTVSYNSSNTTVEMSKYAQYSPCQFKVVDLGYENQTESSLLIYISNSTESTGPNNSTKSEGTQGSNITWSLTGYPKPPKEGTSDASLVGASTASLIVGLIASTYLLA